MIPYYLFAFVMASSSLCLACDLSEKEFSHLPIYPYPTSITAESPHHALMESETMITMPSPIDEKPKTSPQVTYIIHSLIGEFTQKQVDVGMILQHYYPKFLKNADDYDKLTCDEFTNEIIRLYRQEITTFCQHNNDSIIIKNELEDEEISFSTNLPVLLKEKITKALKNHLDTVTFINPDHLIKQRPISEKPKEVFYCYND